MLHSCHFLKFVITVQKITHNVIKGAICSSHRSCYFLAYTNSLCLHYYNIHALTTLDSEHSKAYSVLTLCFLCKVKSSRLLKALFVEAMFQDAASWTLSTHARAISNCNKNKNPARWSSLLGLGCITVYNTYIWFFQFHGLLWKNISWAFQTKKIFLGKK